MLWAYPLFLCFSVNVFYFIVTHNILCINREFVELCILYYVLNIFVIILKKISFPYTPFEKKSLYCSRKLKNIVIIIFKLLNFNRL